MERNLRVGRKILSFATSNILYNLEKSIYNLTRTLFSQKRSSLEYQGRWVNSEFQRGKEDRRRVRFEEHGVAVIASPIRRSNRLLGAFDSSRNIIDER